MQLCSPRSKDRRTRNLLRRANPIRLRRRSHWELLSTLWHRRSTAPIQHWVWRLPIHLRSGHLDAPRRLWHRASWPPGKPSLELKHLASKWRQHFSIYLTSFAILRSFHLEQRGTAAYLRIPHSPSYCHHAANLVPSAWLVSSRAGLRFARQPPCYAAAGS